MSFVFVSGRPALDFVGTLKWRDDEAEEQLHRPADLQRWASAAGLGSPTPRADDDVLDRALALREAIYRTVTDRLHGRRPRRSDQQLLNETAAAPPLTPVLSPSGRVRFEGDFAAALSTLARDALALLGGPDAERLQRCANERCTRIYLDASHGRRRRWCGMTECGNAAKVAAFRARQRTTAGHR